MTDDALELDSRRRLFHHIQDHPGKYLRELQREVGMAMGQLEYHLAELHKAGLVTCLQERHKRYFPNQVPPDDRPVLAKLRQELPRRILLLVLHEGITSKQALLERLDVPRSTLNHHIRHLVDARLLAVGRDGRDATYQVRDEATVARLLVAYQSSWLDRMVDAFLDGTAKLR